MHLPGMIRQRGRLVAAVTAVALVAGGATCVGLVLTHQHHAPRPTVSGPTAAMAQGVSAVTTGPIMARSLPTVVSIPSIGVTSSLLSLGQLSDGSIEVPVPGPLYNRAGWYRYSPTPGSLGPAVIVGHIDSAAHGPSVFFRLRSVKPHALVMVTRADGTVAVFRVDAVGEYPKTNFPSQLVYGNTNHAALRLISCTGSFDSATGHYRDNVVVFATLIRAA
jgi:hypothetical protein